MKKLLLILSFFVFILSLNKSHAQSYSDFSLVSLDGSEVVLSDLLEKGPVLLSFWATWCAPCKDEMKHLNSLYNEYKDKGFTYLAINVDNQKSLSKVKPFISAHGYEFPVVFDTDNKVFEAYMGQDAIPYSVLVSSDKKVVATHTGFVPGDESKIEAEILNLLNDNSEVPDSE
ncbi:MAG: TlpA disulfide reductase family protein [Ignavibacteriaceae bacterium]|jgi:peroxiredoxin|nr:MAG: TlpA family protein disulfide reductase [Chlorobiota bacterium]KXK06340.1 MAG: thiol-disulfide isomerase-like protein [Chlorobi bacterium OLB4]MBV6399147.1 Thiol-disulfide oxidoreductase ResA [Ignavibacteria bacterium]MCC6885406.1 TlpA family protein disulfide reductase [Ignavibacteriales bacterium]MCE7953649.1 TlpA family protein disulfide reductase [Chlorobi bacterium CHB7]MDL1887461.1 TlpA family protein disulfide reductase [Ignavibacteria bacterium CHB1]MEB2329935.1 TlpA disulfide